MKRIRYFRQDDGTFKSKPIEGDHDLFTVQTNGLSWSVTSSQGQTVDAGEAKTDFVMKKQIRDVLKRQGVCILDEVKNFKKKTAEQV